ncbi:MAG: 5-formyltetrahydrofolate cyclo-ligase [Schwartzia sp.]|nr:5-formyltetrahydrofolate cyclo-ligase [Schwartzia sp. (in: firmicutes)]
MTDIAEQKKLLRKEALRRRRSLTAAERQEKSRLIAEKLLTDDRIRSARTVLGFFSMKDEVEMEDILHHLLAMGKKVALPLVTGPGIMEAVELKSFADLVPGDFNIPTVREDAREIIAPHELDCIIVPAVAFSDEGYRLGMGGGFYDRYLVRAEKTARLAVVFDCQIFPEEGFPREEYDQQVDSVFTECNTLEIK